MKKGSRSSHRAVSRKERAEGRNSVVLRFVRIGVADPGLITGFVRLARGSMVVVLGRLVVVIAGLVTILNLAQAGRPRVFRGLVCRAGLIVVAGLVTIAHLAPFARPVLIVRFVVVRTERFSARRCGATQVLPDVSQG